MNWLHKAVYLILLNDHVVSQPGGSCCLLLETTSMPVDKLNPRINEVSEVPFAKMEWILSVPLSLQ